jgi:transketolase
MKMAFDAQASHIGSSFSIVEILVVLYELILQHNPKKPANPDRDRLIISKGHACMAPYALLSRLGYFKKELLKEYAKNGSILMSHVSSEVPGIEFSTGSLGHGLPVGLGMALFAKNHNKKWRTFVLLSDGELNEGSNWEAFMMAGHLKMDNLIVIVDNNKIQAMGLAKDIINIEPLEEKFKAFDWEVARVEDGHDFQKIYDKLQNLLLKKSAKPKILIMDTIKGKGVSFMENEVFWHYHSPDKDEYERALKELN